MSDEPGLPGPYRLRIAIARAGGIVMLAAYVWVAPQDAGAYAGFAVGALAGLVLARLDARRRVLPRFRVEAIPDDYRPTSLVRHPATAPTVAAVAVVTIVSIILNGVVWPNSWFFPGLVLGFGTMVLLVVMPAWLGWAGDRRRYLEGREQRGSEREP